MEITYTPVVVLGAGLAGLSAASRLSENQIQTIVIEKESLVGGLAKSVERDGFIFDIGGHRFHTKKDDILKKVSDYLDSELLKVRRKSKILLDGQFFDYPLQPVPAIFSFGLWKSAKILMSYLFSSLRMKNENLPEQSFEDCVRRSFGRALYEIYFRPYTEKIWGISAKQISKDWVAERIDLINLWDALRKSLFKSEDTPKTYLRHFYYPPKGIGMIAKKMAERIKQKGNQILLGWRVEKILAQDKRINSVIIGNGHQYIKLTSEHFISTIPITELIFAIDPSPPPSVIRATTNLKYRAIVCIFLIIDKEKITDDTWLYFPEKEIIFSRINEPKNWSKECVPDKNKTSLCCQIFCNQNDQTWKTEDEKLVRKCILALSKIGFLKEEEVIDHFVKRIPYAYPVYQINYSSELKIINEFLSQFKNLHLIGRTSTFSYLNMDQVIEMGIEKARELLHK